MAGAIRRQGMSAAAILASLIIENQRCDPPLAEAEVQGIARSVARYRPVAPVEDHDSPNGGIRTVHASKTPRLRTIKAGEVSTWR
jgi:hypothetical protein